MPQAYRLGVVVLAALCSLPLSTLADDQTEVGAGNNEAARLASESPLVQSAGRFINRQTEQIRDQLLRRETVDAIVNRDTCIRHRAGLTSEDKDRLVQQLLNDPDGALVNEADGDLIPGGLRAGVFPALLMDACGQASSRPC